MTGAPIETRVVMALDGVNATERPSRARAMHLDVGHQTDNGGTVGIDEQWLRTHFERAGTAARLASLRSQTFVYRSHHKAHAEFLFNLFRHTRKLHENTVVRPNVRLDRNKEIMKSDALSIFTTVQVSHMWKTIESLSLSAKKYNVKAA